MQGNHKASAGIFGGLVMLGLVGLGYQLADAAIRFKEYERTVTVKGLSEREYEADIVIWPIEFTEAGNDLEQLYSAIEASTARIQQFLADNGIDKREISHTVPAITDKSAQQYGDNARSQFRYTAVQTVTVYSNQVGAVRKIMGSLSQLGKKGIVFSGNSYQAQTEYLFSRLNEVKPAMVEEATREARAVAQKFASDSASRLGKIRKASQGQFSIDARDNNNPHIKKVRVVSTVEYYLSD
ncbi:MAG: SIMPL domain-containing protein [Chromatiaceae bacterium]|nr:SIMPL domain-containing protein [Chromatiaceae bacterium]